MEYNLFFDVFAAKDGLNSEPVKSFSDTFYGGGHPIIDRNNAFYRSKQLDWLVDHLGYKKSSGRKYIITKYMTLEMKGSLGFHLTSADKAGLMQREQEYELMKTHGFIPSSYKPKIIHYNGHDYKVLHKKVTPSYRFMGIINKI